MTVNGIVVSKIVLIIHLPFICSVQSLQNRFERADQSIHVDMDE